MNRFARFTQKAIRAGFLTIAAVTVVPLALAICALIYFLHDWVICIYAATTGKTFRLDK